MVDLELAMCEMLGIGAIRCLQALEYGSLISDKKRWLSSFADTGLW